MKCLKIEKKNQAVHEVNLLEITLKIFLPGAIKFN